MDKEIAVINFGESLGAIEKTKAEQIELAYKPMIEGLKAIESLTDDIYKEFTESEQPSDTLIMRAKRQRLDVAKVRTGADKARKEIKNEYLLASRAIDGAFNQIKWVVNGHEDKMAEVENYFAKIEKERIEALQESRVIEASKYLDSCDGMDFAAMSDDVWNTFLSGAKTTSEQKKEAEAEAARVAEKQALDNSRRLQCAKLAQFIDGFEDKDFSILTDSQFVALVSEAESSLEEHNAEQEAIAVENEKLRKAALLAEEEAKAKEAAAKAESDRKLKEANDAKRKAEEEAQRLAEEKEEAERINAEQERAKEEATDKDKLVELSSVMTTLIANLKSKKARGAVLGANEIISTALAEI